MPLIQITTSVPLSPEQTNKIVAEASKLVADAVGKPETYVMASIQTTAMLMGGEDAPAAFADVRSIGGLSGEVNQSISNQLGALLNDQLGIPARRVYLNFTDVPAQNWGWNGSTFG